MLVSRTLLSWTPEMLWMVASHHQTPSPVALHGNAAFPHVSYSTQRAWENFRDNQLHLAMENRKSKSCNRAFLTSLSASPDIVPSCMLSLRDAASRMYRRRLSFQHTPSRAVSWSPTLGEEAGQKCPSPQRQQMKLPLTIVACDRSIIQQTKPNFLRLHEGRMLKRQARQDMHLFMPGNSRIDGWRVKLKFESSDLPTMIPMSFQSDKCEKYGVTLKVSHKSHAT